MSRYQSSPRGRKRPWEFDHEDERSSNDDCDSASQDTNAEDKSENDKNISISEVKEVLQYGLDSVKSAANRDWAFGGTLANPVNPGLVLEKSGIVGLPLSVHDISRIQEIADPSPNHVDESVAPQRTYWKVSPDKFTLQNPAWEGYPSAHGGGKVKCTFGSTDRTFETSESSKFDMSYIASYADVHRIVEPLVSGCKLQLEYKIYGSGVIRFETAHSLTQGSRDFERQLSNWKTLKKSSDAPSILVYMLDDTPHADPELSILAGADELKAKYLQERCANQKMCAYLAQLQATIPNVSEPSTFELHSLVNLAGGETPPTSAEIKLEDIIQDDPFSYRESNDSDCESEEPSYEEYEYHYKDMVLVLMPDDDRISFFVKNCIDCDIRSWMERLMSEYHTNLSTDSELAEQSKAELENLYSTYFKALQADTGSVIQLYDPIEGLSFLIRGALVLNNKTLFDEFVAHDAGSLPQQLFFDIGNKTNDITLDWCRDGLHKALTKTPTLHQRYRILQWIREGHNSRGSVKEDQEALENWIFRELQDSLTNITTLGSKDAPILMELGAKYGSHFFTQNILPLAKRHACVVEFASIFWDFLRDAHLSQSLDLETLKIAAREVVAGMLAPSTFTTTSSAPIIRRAKTYSSGWYDHTAPLQGHGVGHRLALEVETCIHLGLEDEISQLLRISEEASHHDAQTLHLVFLPFLISLVPILLTHSISLTTPSYQSLFQCTITHFITTYVGPKPAPPTFWSLPPSNCLCSDCHSLNAFLTSPTCQSAEFTATAVRRKHREQVLRAQPVVQKYTRNNAWPPHTLVLEKMQPEYIRVLKAWEGRCEEARKAFSHIGHDALRQLLAEKYTQLMNLQPSVMQHARHVLAGTQAPAPAAMQVKGQKGGIEIVDLLD